MAVPATLLTAIPWSLLIEKAPALLEGSQKLLAAMRSNDRQELIAKADDITQHEAVPSAESNAAAIQALETAVEVLDQDLRNTATIIAHLTEANAGLVRQIRLMKIWLAAVAGATVSSLLGVVILLAR